MAEQVKYIKVSKIDGDNIKQSTPLQYITNITIPYSNGNEVKYPVLNVIENLDFYLYTVGPADNDPDPTDYNNLQYNFSGSVITAPFAQDIGVGYFNFNPNPNPINITQSIIDNLGFYTKTISRFNDLPTQQPVAPSETIGAYQVKTYPQKDLLVTFQGSVTDDGSAGNLWYLGIGFGPSINYLIEPYNIPDNLTQSMSPGSSNTSFTITGTIPSQSIKPGDFIFPYSSNPFTLNQGDSTEMAFGVGTTFKVESSAATVNNINYTTLDPYLTEEFKGSDYDVLLNNVELYRENPLLQDIDYSGNPLVPINANLIRNGTAARGTVPESYYTSLAHTRIRYTGVKNQSSDINIYNINAGNTSNGEPVNIGTYGKVPSVSSLDANIYEFEWGGGTNPEIQGYGAIKTGKILQVSSKDLVKTINPSSNFEIRYSPFYLPIQVNPNLWNRNSTYRQYVSDYYYVLNGNNKINHDISMFAYPNQTNAGSNPTLPQSTKILTTEFGIPLKSSFIVTSSAFGQSADFGAGFLHYSEYSLGKDYPFFGTGEETITSYIRLFDNQGINRLKTNYTMGPQVPPEFLYTGKYPIPGSTNETSSFGPLQKSLNEGHRWFVTFYNDFEIPFDSDEIVPFEMDQKPLGVKGVNEIVGIATASNSGTTPNDTYLLLKNSIDSTLKSSADIVNVGLTTGLNITSKQVGWTGNWPNPTNPAIKGTPGTYLNAPSTTTFGPGSGMTFNVKMSTGAGTLKGGMVIKPEPSSIPLTNAIPNATSSIFRLLNGFIQNGNGTGAYGFLTSDSNGNIDSLIIATGSQHPTQGYWLGGGINYSNGEGIGEGPATTFTLNEPIINNGSRPYYNNAFGTSVVGGPMTWSIPSDAFDIAPEAISIANLGDGNYTQSSTIQVAQTSIGNPINPLNILFQSNDFTTVNNKEFSFKIGAGGLGMLMWRARATGKNEFVIVQDQITGGVAAGAFTSKYTPDYLIPDFEEVTKEYGSNQSI